MEFSLLFKVNQSSDLCCSYPYLLCVYISCLCVYFILSLSSTHTFLLSHCLFVMQMLPVCDRVQH